MKIAKKITAAVCIALAVLIAVACGSSPKAAAVPDELDAAIREASDYLDSNIPGGNKIVILNVQSDSAALSDYIIDELIANAVNDRNFPVVDRQQLDAIRSELNFQWAGEVDDNSAQEIGKMVGAQTIVSGAISKVGNNYRMRIRALEVQTAQVQGQFNQNIPPGETISALMNSSSKGYGTSGGAGTVTAQTVSGGSSSGGSGGEASGSGSGQSAQAPAAPAYKVGDTGPAGGLIFYDKGNSQGGWRYLEAAPANTEKTAVWFARLNNTYGLENAGLSSDEQRTLYMEDIGNGKKNTALLIKAVTNAGEWDTAAQVCDELVVNGFDDWFLPSFNELSQMYGNLARRELGGFTDDQYWSSSNDRSWGAYTVNFKDGKRDDLDGWDKHRVRAIRQF
ncbi:hypothetical protein FACS1894163_10550 [Spirochaetia bacterium]|nr:hypothetical protein FACS1894163_10550 [Spirochaetia bacterium]